MGKSVDLGDDVEIGFLAVVQGRRISIGRHSSVGTMSYVSCESIQIGEDAKIREQVYVGGPQLPDSRFELGSRTIILQLAFINPTKPVVIGEVQANGQFQIVWKSPEGTIRAQAWSPYIPESAKKVADWTYPWVCGNCTEPKFVPSVALAKR